MLTYSFKGAQLVTITVQKEMVKIEIAEMETSLLSVPGMGKAPKN